MKTRLDLRPAGAAAGLALVCAALAVGQEARSDRLFALLDDEQSPYAMVAAHRAAHDGVPENSLAAIEQAIALGVDIIEIDVRTTLDGVPVILHDQHVDRTTTGQGDVETLSWAEVRALRLIGAEGDSLSEEHPPSLEAALGLAKDRILIDLDMKTDQVDAVMAVIQRLDMEDQVVWFDSDLAVLDRAQALDPDTQVMPRAHAQTDMAPLCARYAPMPVIHIDPGFNTPETVNEARACGARVWINALGEVDQALGSGETGTLDALLASGATIIQTDRPEDLIAALERAGRR
jgi:glycerophosphoryl diester phosphodiesterase